MDEILFKVGGMTCTLCSSKLENRLGRISGIKEAKVNYSTEITSVTYDKNLCSREEIFKAVNSSGFFIDDEDGRESAKYFKRLKNQIIIGFILLAPLMISMISCWMYDLSHIIDPKYNYKITLWLGSIRYKLALLHNWRFQILVITPIQFIIGFQFYKNAFYSILSRSPGMDLLVSVGTLATYGYGLYIALKGPAFNTNFYFEAGGMIILFVLLGKYIEALAKKKTSNSIEALIRLQPKTARIVTEKGEIEKNIEDIEIGEVVVIYPGEVIPIDGKVISGESFIDESMITGESNPVRKKKGDVVAAGTLNGMGNFKAVITKNAEDTVLSSIIHLVEEAQVSKPDIQKLTDKISRIFVPAVLVIALGTFCFWYFYVYNTSSLYVEKAVLLSVSVLVVSCPCALGIAIPMAVSLGMGVSASNGIFIKNVQALQDLYKIDTIVFDKTGTLTEGRCSVHEFIRTYMNCKYSDDEIIIFSASLEQKSEHSFGKAIFRYSAKKNLKLVEPEKFQIMAGKGIWGIVNGKEIRIGNNKIVHVPEEYVHEENNTVFTHVYVEIDGKLEAVFKIDNDIKSGAAETIQVLKDKGVEVIMMTGDNCDIAQNIGRRLGIENVYYEMMPSDKVKIINELKEKNRFAAMVGDGINDAPALAASNVAIAIGTGADAAIQSSDITILGDDLNQIITAMDLSKRTIKKIKSNLFLAIVYNAVSIPFAVFGNLSPEVASAAMVLSSISVVLNSLGIKKYKRM